MKTMSILLLCTLGFAACEKESTTHPSADPLERWKSFGLHNYTIDQTRSCYCIDGGQIMRLTIRSDTVNAALRLSDGLPLSLSEFRSYYSIDSLFAQIRNRTADSLVIRYNDKYGYPEYLDINPQQHPVDGGVLYETANLLLLK